MLNAATPFVRRYSLPAAVGAALANRDAGRITAAILGDGDILFTPGAFWSAANLKLPLLMVVHNNGAYHQEAMHVRRMSNFRNRPAATRAAQGDYAPIGTSIMDPSVDFSKLANSMGVWAESPGIRSVEARRGARARDGGREIGCAGAGRRADATAMRPA